MKRIDRLLDVNRDEIRDTEKIQQEVSNFYQNLLGTQAHILDTVDPKVLWRGKMIAEVQSATLI